jgi:penicillin-binding protein-related factor A (putative recombinase)
MNSGKLFEEDFRLSCKDEVAITRLYDAVGGMSGVKNICDFIIGYFPYTFYLELKSTSTGTLPLRNISDNQYKGLLQMSQYKNQVCGLLIKYAKFGEHYFVPIEEVKRLKYSDLKSISRAHIKAGKVKHVDFWSSIRRTRFDYNFHKFVKEYNKVMVNKDG